ncbi:MAG: type VI secretion system ATPase TssH [Alphaproteobacteria bacterium]|nr:MAG: type VI secretion system ATPase TssH [Alphaproteobacteria bacterium]
MGEIKRVALFGKLDPLAYKAIEGATTFAKLRGNRFVELVHWINLILQAEDSDLHRILRRFEIDPARLAADMTAALDRLPRGASALSDFSEDIEHAIQQGWLYASLMFDAGRIRTGHLILAILRSANLRNALFAMSDQFRRIRADDLAEEFAAITAGSPEEAEAAPAGGGVAPGVASGAMAPAQMGREEALRQFTRDLTEAARQGRIDRIVGRDEEIRQIVDILMRRRQNNPILTGEAGVGKTAVVEGFALRIADGDVPPALRQARLLELDVAALQAGASMKGEFENRLKAVIEEVQASPTPIIMFIDEAHTLVGAGGAAGTGDAANLLKPALARGTLRTIAATTWAEYKKHIEKDPALTRRFQVVQVHEPDEARAHMMMRGIAGMLEKHHKVQILDEALEAAVKLSHRYIPARQLPDKAVSLIDTACARVAISQHTKPPQIDDSERRIAALETEREIIGRDEAAGLEVEERRARVEAELAAERARLADLTRRWEEEKAVVDEILALRAELRGAGADPDARPAAAQEDAAQEDAAQEDAARGDAAQEDAARSTDADRARLRARLRERQADLQRIQGENPLILPIVDAQAVASVVGDWTGIPVGRMVRNEIETILNLPRLLARRVIGQDHAMEMIARRIQTSRAGLDNPSKPVGVFLLAGTSGVGKTETALALAEILYGGEHNLITINMSEFQEAHTVSTLKGAPPGYVGYGEGGILTEAVRRRPYSVVLLDEVEKAHPDVHEIFFQVFDKGQMEDGEGRMIDFRNTLILLTSNVGSELIMDMCADPDLMPDPEGIAKALREPLLKVFPPALLGRLVTIPYYPLSPDMLAEIVRLQLSRIVNRVRASHGVPMTYDDAVVQTVVDRCQEVESGGRMIDAILTNTMLPTISAEFLRRMMEGGRVARVHVGARDGEFTYEFD